MLTITSLCSRFVHSEVGAGKDASLLGIQHRSVARRAYCQGMYSPDRRYLTVPYLIEHSLARSHPAFPRLMHSWLTFILNMFRIHECLRLNHESSNAGKDELQGWISGSLSLRIADWHRVAEPLGSQYIFADLRRSWK